jgi:hypothetical protein
VVTVHGLTGCLLFCVVLVLRSSPQASEDLKLEVRCRLPDDLRAVSVCMYTCDPAHSHGRMPHGDRPTDSLATRPPTAVHDTSALTHLRVVLPRQVSWCLTNIAAGSHAQTQHVLSACPCLITFVLPGPSAQLQEQACWVLGNIAADGAEYRQVRCWQGGARSDHDDDLDTAMTLILPPPPLPRPAGYSATLPPGAEYRQVRWSWEGRVGNDHDYDPSRDTAMTTALPPPPLPPLTLLPPPSFSPK